MPVYRVNKNENFTTISNTHLKDQRLTLKAKGLMTIVLSLSPEWNYSIAGLVAICKEGETAVKGALKELKECGYLTITKIPPSEKNPKFEYLYEFYEEPLKVGNLPLENLPVENLEVENQGQLNTNKLNTENKNINKNFNKNKGAMKRGGKEDRRYPFQCPKCGTNVWKNTSPVGYDECPNCFEQFPK